MGADMGVDGGLVCKPSVLNESDSDTNSVAETQNLCFDERCGPCTADCYENCGVWMPSGSEIREVWGERQRDMRRLD
jgi:hypothetical protein